MASSVAEIVNRALDAIGRPDLIVGDIDEGTSGANPAQRAYTPALEQLLRCAHWTFARKVAPLALLSDATGQTPGVGTLTIAPWIYSYQLPTDCMQARFLPRNYLNPTDVPIGNITTSNPSTPQTSVMQQAYGYGMPLIPAPFLLSIDTNNPVDLTSNWEETNGTSPAGRSVVLTNVKCAHLVYTAYMPYPSMWDPLFEQAMVDLLTVRLAMPLARNPQFGERVRDTAMVTLKQTVMDARVASNNEAGGPQTVDHTPDFLAIRNRGSGWAGGGPGFNAGPWAGMGEGCGVLGYGWAGLSLGGGGVF